MLQEHGRLRTCSGSGKRSFNVANDGEGGIEQKRAEYLDQRLN